MSQMNIKAMIITATLLLACALSQVHGLDNGLALTPPMGWLSWERFRCNIDCENDPHNCISETLFRDMADRMAADGYLDAGYEYVIIDDCWLAKERDSKGRLQPDPDRFPNGIKALADYIHGKGLKFGIYEDYGTKTCAGYPGSLGHLKIDANTFAEWGVDYVKMDGCNVEYNTAMEKGHLEMAKYLNETGRPIVFSCEFPYYLGDKTNYAIAIEACNLWRNHPDVRDSFKSIKSIYNFYKKKQDLLVSVAGPGHWNDPDMLVIGNFHLNYTQSKIQMTMWTIWSAPLIMSNDLRNIKKEFSDLLLNKLAIRINQDPLGIQGYLHRTIENVDIWIKSITPKAGEDFSYALGFVNTAQKLSQLEITLESLNINPSSGYQGGYILQDVFEPFGTKIVLATDQLKVTVRPSDAVLWHLTVVDTSETNLHKN